MDAQASSSSNVKLSLPGEQDNVPSTSKGPQPRISFPNSVSDPPHFRRTSTLSTGTLRTSTSENSHPSQPLLRTSKSEYIRNPDGQHQERRYIEEHRRMGRPKKRWSRSNKRPRAIAWILEGVLGAWSSYTTIRYFMAYASLQTVQDQAISLALGTSSALAVWFIGASIILSVSRPYLLMHGASRRIVNNTNVVLLSSACALTLAPAIVNFALVFVNRHRLPCVLDVDVIWTALGSGPTNCSPTFGASLGLAIVRLFLTASFILALYFFRRKLGGHTRSGSGQKHLTSPSTIRSTLPTVSPSPEKRLSSTRPSSWASAGWLSRRPRLPRNASALSTTTEEPVSSPETNVPAELSDPAPVQGPAPYTEEELNVFVDRFRALIAQITHETDDALRIARPDTYAGYNPNNNNQMTYYDPYAPEFYAPYSHEAYHAAGPVQYGNNHNHNVHRHTPSSSLTYSSSSASEYEEDEEDGEDLDFRDFNHEHVRVLGGYIRRMPTIESVGSRERSMTQSMYSGRSKSIYSIGSRSVLSSLAAASNPPSRSGSMSLSNAVQSVSGGHGTGAVPSEVGDFHGSGSIRSSGTRSTSGTTNTGNLSFHTVGTGSVSLQTAASPTSSGYEGSEGGGGGDHAWLPRTDSRSPIRQTFSPAPNSPGLGS